MKTVFLSCLSGGRSYWRVHNQASQAKPERGSNGVAYTHKARVLAATRCELVDRLAYALRLDLWYLANSTAGTLPKQYAGAAMNEIARAEG